jgi:hypothetical protein
MFFANAILVLYLLWVQEDISYWLQKSAEGRVLFLLQHTVTAGLLYGGVLYLLGIRVKQFRLER